jgi:hypothetical protein
MSHGFARMNTDCEGNGMYPCFDVDGISVERLLHE